MSVVLLLLVVAVLGVFIVGLLALVVWSLRRNRTDPGPTELSETPAPPQ